MMRGKKSLLAILWLLLALAVFPADILSQQGYTLDELVEFVDRGFSPELILTLAQRDCLAFRMDAKAEERLREAGATDELLEVLKGVCYMGPKEDPLVQPEPEPEPTPPSSPQPDPPPAPAASILYDPGAATLRSLILPGLGQFYSDRPVMGTLFMAGWAGALGLGFLAQEVTVDCLDRVEGPCPSNRIFRRTVGRPLLPVGVGGALAVAVVSALEARSGAGKANALSTSSWEGVAHGGTRLEIVPFETLPQALSRSGGDLVLVQLRF
jgi:hypothetical protein